MRVMRPLTLASTEARIFARTVPITSSVTGCGFASIVSTRTVTTGGGIAAEVSGALRQPDRPRARLAAMGRKTRITPPYLLPTPSLPKIVSAGQNPVKVDWTRFNPTNAVNSNHKELTQCARAILMRINVPARIQIAPSSFVLFCVFMFVELFVIIDVVSIYAYSQHKSGKSYYFFSMRRKAKLQGMTPEALEFVAARFRVLSEASRLKLILALEEGEKNVTGSWRRRTHPSQMRLTSSDLDRRWHSGTTEGRSKCHLLRRRRKHFRIVRSCLQQPSRSG